LGQIRSKELTNVVVVVVRYFGGVKLGVGGLVQAYKTATADAFTNAEIVERTVDDVLTLDFDYLAMNDVMRIVKDHDLRMQAPVYELRCSMQLIVRRGMVGQISALLSKVENLTFEIN
jgi:putative IMPACT (imprinted ancient) family translation regulator